MFPTVSIGRKLEPIVANSKYEASALEILTLRENNTQQLPPPRLLTVSFKSNPAYIYWFLRVYAQSHSLYCQFPVSTRHTECFFWMYWICCPLTIFVFFWWNYWIYSDIYYFVQFKSHPFSIKGKCNRLRACIVHLQKCCKKKQSAIGFVQTTIRYQSVKTSTVRQPLLYTAGGQIKDTKIWNIVSKLCNCCITYLV